MSTFSLTRFFQANTTKNQRNNATNSSTHTQHQHLIQPHQRLAVAVDIAIVVRPHPSLWMLAMVPQVELHFSLKLPEVILRVGGEQFSWEIVSPRWRGFFLAAAE